MPRLARVTKNWGSAVPPHEIGDPLKLDTLLSWPREPFYYSSRKCPLKKLPMI